MKIQTLSALIKHISLLHNLYWYPLMTQEPFLIISINHYLQFHSRALVKCYTLPCGCNLIFSLVSRSILSRASFIFHRIRKHHTSPVCSCSLVSKLSGSNKFRNVGNICCFLQPVRIKLFKIYSNERRKEKSVGPCLTYIHNTLNTHAAILWLLHHFRYLTHNVLNSLKKLHRAFTYLLLWHCLYILPKWHIHFHWCFKQSMKSYYTAQWTLTHTSTFSLHNDSTQ